MPNAMDENMNQNNIYSETLESATDYIKKLIVGIKKYIEYMTSGRISESGDLLISIIEGLDWEVKALSLIKEKLNIDLDISEVNAVLIDLSNAIQNNDYVLITDLFEYEILPILEKWKEYLENKK